MTTIATTRPVPTSTDINHRERTPGMGRLALLAAMVVTFLAASAAPTPLYQHYDQVWHGTALTTTVAFGIYAIAVLVGLLTLGELASHLGRRPILLAAIAGQAVAVGLFATAGSFTPLLAGRVIQGLATGAALGTLGAAMIETHRVRGTLVSAAAPGAGTGLGALLAGVVVAYLPWPTHLIYLILLVAFLGEAIGVTRLFGRHPRQAGALASLRPHVAVPRTARAAFVTATPVLFTVWALAGFYGSLGPALARGLAGSTSVVIGGLGLFILAGVASLTTVVLRNRPARQLMMIGIVALVIGIAGTAVAIHLDSTTLYFVMTGVAGFGFGGGFQGGILTLIPLAEPIQRAGLLSAAFVVSYLGLGVPAVIAGVLVSHGLVLTQVATGYAIALIAVSLISAVGLLRSRAQR